MNGNYYWNENTFGAELPENWENVMTQANDMIDEYIAAGNTADDDIRNYSENLWTRYCNTGSLN